MLEKTEGAMDNPETLATLDTQHTERIQQITKNTTEKPK